MSDRLIYALIDPVTDHVRYVGLSTRGMARPQLHLKTPKPDDRTHRANWIRSLMVQGKLPIVRVVEYCSSDDELSEAEASWISLFGLLGCPLTNHRSGGFNGKPDEETKRNISSKLKGYVRSAEVRQRMSDAKLGNRNPMYGRAVSEETRQKRANSMKGEKNHRYGLTPPNGEATRFKPGQTPWNKKQTTE